jgi:hypothetical protein
MKRQTIFLVLTILSLQLIQAGGVGITPVYYKEFFEPGLTKTYPFHSFSSSSDEGIKLYIEGDLAEYVNLSTTYLPSSGSFTVTISLPDKIEIPGTHKIYVGATEARKINNTMVGGIAAIRGRIDILVPYPGKYSESTFKISNINEGEETPYELEIQNLGTQSLTVKPTIEIFKADTTQPLLTKKLTEKNMETKETWSIIDTLETQNLPPGEYQAIATIDWGEITTLNQTFRIGEFLIDIVDYDYQFEQGKINPFKIKIENKWNTKIEEVYAAVSITDQGVVVGSFKTVSVDTNPWEIKDITGYFDTTTLKPKRYTAKIVLSYGGATTSKLVAIYVNLPPAKIYRTYIIISILIIILVIAAFAYLIWKVRKLEHKNEKKSKKKK